MTDVAPPFPVARRTALFTIGAVARRQWRRRAGRSREQRSGRRSGSLSLYAVCDRRRISRHRRRGRPTARPSRMSLTSTASCRCFTADRLTGRGTQVTHGRFDCHDPFWSPDGTRLYYISLARDRDGLWSISAAGGEPEFVMEDVNSATLVARRQDAGVLSGPRGGETYSVLVVAGRIATASVHAPLGDRRRNSLATVHFSPDGSKLGAWVIANQHPNSGCCRWAAAAPFTVRPPVADLPVTPAAFSWLPDSRRVMSAMSSPRPGVHLWLTDTGGASPDC